MAGFTHVLFDFFGTLVHYDEGVVAQRLERSHSILVEAGAAFDYDAFAAQWAALFAEHEQRAQRTLDEFSMDTLSQLFLTRALARTPDPALRDSFRDTFLAEWSQGVRYLPGVAELLAQLSQRFTIALVSNTHHAPLIHGHLAAMGADSTFATVVTSVEHGRRKPSACIFERALALTGGTAQTAVYVGDSYGADYQGALAAGLHPLLIDPNRKHPIEDAHRIADVFGTRTFLDSSR